MLQMFRNFFKSKIGVLVTLGFLVLIALAFASTDVAHSGMFGGGPAGDDVAVVGKRDIAAVDLSANVTNALNQVRQQNPTLTMEAFAANGGVQRVYEQMLSRAALAEFGAEHGMRTGKRLVDSEISKIPAFRDVSGNFSEAAYRATLSQQKLTDAMVREDLSMGLFAQQVVTPVGMAPRMPRAMSRQYAQLLRETRKGAIGLIPSAAFTPQGDPTDAQLQTYYQTSRAQYIRPERRVIRYAAFGEEALGAVPAPTEAEIAVRFQRDAAKYAAQEDRTLTQVVVPTQAAAQQLAGAVSGGMQLEAAARAQGLATSAVGPVDKAQYSQQASAAVADAAFAAARGALAAPARGGLGWYVVRVDKIEGRPARSLAQVRGEITNVLATEKRAAALGDLTARIEQELDDGRNLSEVATELKVTLQQSRPITAVGQVYGTQESAPPVLAPVLSTAFEMSEGKPQLAVLDPGRQFLIYDVSDITASATAPLGEIRQEVVAGWRRDQGFTASREASDRILKRVAGGQSLADALKAEQVTLPPVDQVNLNRQQISQSGQVPPPLALLFSMAQGTVKRLAAPGNNGWFVIQLSDIETPQLDANDPLIAATSTQLESVLSDEYVQQFVAAVQQQVGVTRNDKAVEALITQLTGQGG